MVPLLRYLLDTHAWIWAVLSHPRLSSTARQALSSLGVGERVGLAAISVHEAAWLASRGRLVLPSGAGDWADWLREASQAPSLEVLPLTVEVAIESRRFSAALPSDPADRLIAATARLNRLTLLTADDRLRTSSELVTLW